MFTPKQANAVRFNYTGLYGYITQKEIDKLLEMTHDKHVHEADADSIVGLVWNIAVKDDREGVTQSMKKYDAETLKQIIYKYENRKINPLS